MSAPLSLAFLHESQVLLGILCESLENRLDIYLNILVMKLVSVLMLCAVVCPGHSVCARTTLTMISNHPSGISHLNLICFALLYVKMAEIADTRSSQQCGISNSVRLPREISCRPSFLSAECSPVDALR